MTRDTAPASPSEPLPTFEDVLVARERIAGRVLRTPVLSVPALDEQAGVQLFLKAENLQRIGAFKARGAVNAVLATPEADRARGFVTFSSGNHGQALALAGREVGAAVTVVMPETAPAVKVDAVRALGANVVFAGTSSEHRWQVASAIVEQTGATMIPPFDDARVIAGQGTATLELCEQLQERGVVLDAVLVPVGGGGLLAGACLAASGPRWQPQIVAVEPQAANAFERSMQQCERVSITPGPTLADGLKPTMIGARNYAIASRAVRATFSVDEQAIGQATIALLLHAKVLAEPSGACALALALERLLPPGLSKVGVLLSGGNIAPEVLRDLLATYGARTVGGVSGPRL